nr:MAG TPA: hypothetical protein [Caudoviricetes sp.]
MNVDEQKFREVLAVAFRQTAVRDGRTEFLPCEVTAFAIGFRAAHEAIDPEKVAEELRAYSIQLMRAYGHLPKDCFPGPPTTISLRLREIADQLENRQPSTPPSAGTSKE